MKERCDDVVRLLFEVEIEGEIDLEARVGMLDKDRKEAQLAAVVRNRNMSIIAVNSAGKQRESRNAYYRELSRTLERNDLVAVQKIQHIAY